MAKYLDIATIQDLITARNLIFSERNTQYANHDVDVLDNDVLSSLSIWEIVSQYEPDYRVNFSRTGEDAVCNGTIIEQKCSLVKKHQKDQLSSSMPRGLLITLGISLPYDTKII